MNYIELERTLLTNIKNIKSVKPYESNNIITPWVVGFVPIGNDIKYEVSYGAVFGGGWCIGLTPFYKGKLMEDRNNYSKCFFDDEINNIDNFIVDMKQQLSNV